MQVLKFSKAMYLMNFRLKKAACIYTSVALYEIIYFAGLWVIYNLNWSSLLSRVLSCETESADGV